MHLGHRAVIGKAAEIARENKDISAAVFTFDTATVTSKGGSLGCILGREDKLSMLGQLGAEYVYSPDFASFKEYTACRCTVYLAGNAGFWCEPDLRGGWH